MTALWPSRRASATARRTRCGADAAVTAVGRDRDRPEQQSRLAAGAGGMPEPRGADDAFALGGDEREPFGRQSAVAQALRGLAERVAPKASSSSASRALTSRRPFMTDVGMSQRSFPARRASRARTERTISSQCAGKGRQGEPASRDCSDDVGLQRREAVEGDRRVGRRIGAGALDQHLVADLQADRQLIRLLLVQHVGRVAGRAGEHAGCRFASPSRGVWIG